MHTNFIMLIVLPAFVVQGSSASASATQARIDQDIAAGRPVVIQLSVALADNKHQEIVPVPEAIGDGQNAGTNLYWGASYGVKTYMTRDAGWTKLADFEVEDIRILERIVLTKSFLRQGRRVTAYLVADAWDGRFIRDTVEQFMAYNAGNDAFQVQAGGKLLNAGGAAHLIAYIGHNVLIDMVANESPAFSSLQIPADNPPNDAIILACKSQPYFSYYLKRVSAHPLLLTTGLMAPEAYSFDAAVSEWILTGDDLAVRKAAAAGYDKYQNTGLKAAERLFGVK